MAQVINMPRLSDTMEEGVVAKWLKNVGDTIEEGDMLAEIETDKATMEFESFHEGVLLHIGIKEGESAKVDSLLAIIGEKGEDFAKLLSPKRTSDSGNKEESVEIKNNDATSGSVDIPKDVEVITMPRLSDTMTEGTVASWLKKIGDTVNEGDILAEIETDKATMEFESFHEGALLYIGVNEGESAPVDSVLAVIGKKGTDISALIESFKSGSFGQTTEKEETKTIEQPKKETTTKTEPATIVSQPTTTASGGRIFASPLAKKIAKEKGINLNQVKGSGEGGRIVKSDIENFTPIQMRL